MRCAGESTSGVTSSVLPPLLFCAVLVKCAFCVEMLIKEGNEPGKREPIDNVTVIPTLGTVVRYNGPTVLRPFFVVNNNKTQLINDTKNFEASKHLDQIRNRENSGFPSSNTQQTRFENTASSDTNHESQMRFAQSVKQNLVKFYDDSSGYTNLQSEEDSLRNPQIFYPTTVTYDHFNSRPSEISEENDQPLFNTDHHYPSPSNTNQPSIANSAKLHDNRVLTQPVYSHHYQFGFTPMHYDNFGKIPGDIDHHPRLHPAVVNPDNVVLVSSHETSYTRTHTFPYHFYQPYFDADVTYTEPSVVGVIRERRVSPWKKVIHLVGALIPLGLLLAAVTPKVTHIQNSSQPNIVLSKRKSPQLYQLPIEHKVANYKNKYDCEEKTICLTILEGEKMKSNLLKNMLWNVATKISEEVARNNGLYEIFDAVKKRNCNLLHCKEKS